MIDGIKIKPEHKEIVEKYKRTISALSKEQESAYEDLTLQLGGDSEWLFEYIYNTGSSDEYTKMVEEKLFE